MLTSVLASAPTYSTSKTEAFAQVSIDSVSDIGNYFSLSREGNEGFNLN